MTRLEYDEAQRLELPSLIYIIDEENQPILPKHVETGPGAEKLRALKEQLNKREQQLQQQQTQTQNKQKQQQTNETSNTNVSLWKTNWTKESFIQKLVEKIAQCSVAINSEETKEDQWDLAKELTAVGVSPEQDFIGEVLGGRTFEKILI